jgi:dynein heavy chain
VKEHATEVLQLNDQLAKATDKIKSFNEREALFKQPVTDYEEINTL